MEISRLSFSCIFTCLLQYFPQKNRAILVQKLWGEKKLSMSVFGYFKTKKKVPMAIKLEGWGGGKALMVWPLVEDFFFAASLTKNFRVKSQFYERIHLQYK